MRINGRGEEDRTLLCENQNVKVHPFAFPSIGVRIPPAGSDETGEGVMDLRGDSLAVSADVIGGE